LDVGFLKKYFGCRLPQKIFWMWASSRNILDVGFLKKYFKCGLPQEIFWM